MNQRSEIVTCRGIAEYVRRVLYDPWTDTVHVELGYYSEVGLTIYRSGRIRVDWCNEILFDELLNAVECVKELLAKHENKPEREAR